MDTTTSSLGVEETYVSCITIDGAPILPPIMTEANRAEMRRYREIAVERERNKRLFNMKAIIKPNDDSRPNTGSSLSNFSPVTGMASTPFNSGRRLEEEKTSQVYEFCNEANKENIPQMPQSVRLNEDQFVREINLPVSTSNSSQDEDGDGDVANLEDVQVTDSESDSGDNFASAASSTGTFIIKTSLSKRDSKQDLAYDDGEAVRSEGEVEELDKENEPPVSEPRTVIRNPQLDDFVFKRKRRARYFDTNDDEIDQSPISEEDTHKTTGTSSTSLSKYLSTTVTGTPTGNINSSGSSSLTATPRFFPNVVPDSAEDESANVKTRVSEQSPTFTINTNFAATALALSKERISPRSTAKASRKSKYFSSPESTPPSKKELPTNVTDPDFDFVLTKEIPGSAVKVDLSQIEEPETQTESESGSDKENRMDSMERKKHVRKLSYTLIEPSAALLAASSSSTFDGNMYSQTLAPIHSVASSVGIPSVENTPAKAQETRLELQGSTPTCGELDAKMNKVQMTLAKLQQLNLGKGKKAHLERYLEELTLTDKEDLADGTSSVPQVAEVLNKIQDQHQKQLDSLMEAYKLQALKMQEEFEREKIKLLNDLIAEKQKNEISIVNNNTATTMTTAPAPSPVVLADTSNLRNYYIANDTPTKHDPKSENLLSADRSEASSVISSSNYDKYHQRAPETPAAPPEQLGNVQLSKLQQKMQKMNPALFKYPPDARSPLLKGLVFPDPLDRPMPPLKIPPRAYSPTMKPKFERLTAAVKGYLTRRLLHSEKIQIIIQTVKDTVELLLNLYEEFSPSDKGFQVKSQDEELHRRLLQQLTGACSSFHDVFFKLSVKERMAIIANDREKIRAKALKNVLSRHQPVSPTKKGISNATLKSIERRLTLGRSPTKKDNQTSRKSRKSVKPSGIQSGGSHSVKPKAVSSYNLSPKRRRMSYWNEKPEKAAPKAKGVSTSRTSSAISNFDQNGNKYSKSASDSARSTNTASSYYAQETSRSSGWSSDTFLVPSTSSSRQNSWLSQSSSPTTKANNSRTLTNPRSSIANVSQSGGSNRSVRSSTNRAPWKK